MVGIVNVLMIDEVIVLVYIRSGTFYHVSFVKGSQMTEVKELDPREFFRECVPEQTILRIKRVDGDPFFALFVGCNENSFSYFRGDGATTWTVSLDEEIESIKFVPLRDVILVLNQDQAWIVSDLSA